MEVTLIYFNDSKNHQSLWFVINLDNNIPKKINKNILLPIKTISSYLLEFNISNYKKNFYPLDKNKFFILKFCQVTFGKI